MLVKLELHLHLWLAKLSLAIKSLAVKFSSDVKQIEAEVAGLEAKLKTEVKLVESHILDTLELRLRDLETDVANLKAKVEPPVI